MPDQPDQPPHTVFVSHAHADNTLADRYVDALRKRGLDVWYDRTNLQGGQRLSKEIERELEQRTALVALLTPASVASYWVDMEVSAFRDLAAHDALRLLLPVRVAECSVPLLLRGLFWIDAVALGFDVAVEAMAKALRAPASAIARVDNIINSGNELLDQENYAEALNAYEAALALDPSEAFAWSAKGFALDGLERYVEALAAFERALELQPDFAWAWQGKGEALLGLRRDAEALAPLERALVLNPSDEYTWLCKGMTLFRLGRRDEAHTAFQRMAELHQEDE